MSRFALLAVSAVAFIAALSSVNAVQYVDHMPLEILQAMEEFEASKSSVDSQILSQEASEALFPLLTNLFADEQCKFRADEANWWDLNGMKKYQVEDVGKNDSTFKMSFCRNSPDSACVATKSTGKIPQSLCEYKTDGSVVGIASFLEEPLPTYQLIDRDIPAKGITIRISNGDECVIATEDNLTAKYFFIGQLLCDMTAEKPTLKMITSSLCMYRAEIKSKFGCTGYTESDGGVGWIVIIIFISLLALYFVAGFIVCTKRYGKTGKEAIPNIEFWSALPSLVVAGVLFTFAKIKSLFGSKTGSGAEYETFEST